MFNITTRFWSSIMTFSKLNGSGTSSESTVCISASAFSCIEIGNNPGTSSTWITSDSNSSLSSASTSFLYIKNKCQRRN